MRVVDTWPVALVLEWGPLVVLVALGWLLRRFIESAYRRLKKRVDQKVPDDMPVGGGAWLDEQLRARGLEGVIRVFAGSRGATDIDAYFPTASTIVLSREVHEKRDASFWAVAGHELGHALVRRSSPLVAFPLALGRILQVTCTRTATFLILANILYARRDIDAIAFGLLTVSLVAWVFVLVDEALASALSVRMLAKDERVGRRALVGAITALAAAFMTYAGGFVGQVVLVLARETVVDRIHRHREFVPREPMGAAKLAIVSVLAFVLLLLSIHAIVRELRRREVDDMVGVAKATLTGLVHELARGLLGATVVALVWAQPLGKWFPLVCVAGLLASTAFVRLATYLATLVVRLVAAVVVLPLYIVAYVVGALLFGEGKEGAGKHEEAPMSKRTAAEYDRLWTELHNSPSLYERASELAFPLLHVAFVVALYAAMASR